MSQVLEFLYDRHVDQTCYIVGKGLSLAHLTANYFGAGFVISINEAILIVQELGLDNPIYSLQKDGCGTLAPHERCVVQSPNYLQMARPQSNIPVFMQQGYADFCLADYPQRYLFNLLDDFGFDRLQTVSLRIAIAMAKIMGACNIVLLCCDSLATGDLGTYSFGNPIAAVTQSSYAFALYFVREDLASIRHSLVTPGATC